MRTSDLLKPRNVEKNTWNLNILKTMNKTSKEHIHLPKRNSRKCSQKSYPEREQNKEQRRNQSCQRTSKTSWTTLPTSTLDRELSNSFVKFLIIKEEIGLPTRLSIKPSSKNLRMPESTPTNWFNKSIQKLANFEHQQTSNISKSRHKNL